MNALNFLGGSRSRSEALTVALLIIGLVASANAQDVTVKPAANSGRIEFDHPGAAKATVEVDLSRDMFGDLFGISDAALAGVTEALNESPEAQGSEAIRMAAAKAAAVREFVSIAKNVVNEVRVRIYEGLQADASQKADVIAHYDQQLNTGGWDNAVRVREGDQNVRVSLMRGDGAIKGLFISVADGDDLVLVNVTCDVSPENAKLLSAAAVKGGLQAGLGEQLEKALKKHGKSPQ